MSLFLTSLRLTLRQCLDGAFLRLVLLSVLASAVLFGGLLALAVFLSTHFLPSSGWMAWLAGTLGGALALVLAIWFFVPISIVIVWMFTDSVSSAVERRFYPHLPPPPGSSVGSQISSAFGLMGRAVALYTMALPALFVPGLGMVVFTAIGVYQLGRELFETVALRRARREDFAPIWQQVRFSAWGVGACLTAMAIIPGLNLLAPVLGTAAMTHIFARRL